MSKKFDVVIGNPPYNEDSTGGSGNQMPIYHQFMDAAYAVGEVCVLITPARFLFEAGYTPKAWNAKMLADPHLSVEHYVANSDDLFPNTEIMGGVAVTLRDSRRVGDPIGTFSSFPELNSILGKVAERRVGSLVEVAFTSSRSYRYTELMHEENPLLAEMLPKSERYKLVTSAFSLPVFHSALPTDGKEYVRMFGLVDAKRVYRWIRRDYVSGPESLEKYKVAVPASRNAGGMLGTKPAQVTGDSLLLQPGTGVTQTFITIGAFSEREEGQNCLSFVRSKFARVLLGALKVTQHNPRNAWRHVPLEDFSAESDIDWSVPQSDIDRQLYAKYGLDEGEILFIEEKVKSMA